MTQIELLRTNIGSSISEYRGLYLPFTPNQKEKDTFLCDILANLDSKIPLQQLAIVCINRSPRMQYLMNWIEPTFLNDLEFDKGTYSGYSFYGSTPDTKNAFSLVIGRIPTLGYTQTQSIAGMIESAIFYIRGFVRVNGTDIPFTLNCLPFYALMSYTNTQDTIEIKYVYSDASPLISDLYLKVSDTLIQLIVTINKNPISYTFQPQSKKYQTTSTEFSTCWSYTQGSIKEFPGMVGWFDRQALNGTGAMNGILKQAGYSVYQLFNGGEVPNASAYFWFTITDGSTQYYSGSIDTQGKEGDVFKRSIKKYSNNSLSNSTAIITVKKVESFFITVLEVKIDSKTYTITNSFSPGICVPFFGNPIFVRPGVLTPSSNGFGMIGCENFNSPIVPNWVMMEALKKPINDYTKLFNKYSFGKVFPSFMFLLVLLYVILLVIFFIIYFIFRFIKLQ